MVGFVIEMRDEKLVELNADYVQLASSFFEFHNINDKGSDDIIKYFAADLVKQVTVCE